MKAVCYARVLGPHKTFESRNRPDKPVLYTTGIVDITESEPSEHIAAAVLKWQRQHAERHGLDTSPLADYHDAGNFRLIREYDVVLPAHHKAVDYDKVYLFENVNCALDWSTLEIELDSSYYLRRATDAL